MDCCDAFSTKIPLYVRLARCVGAYHRCVASGNREWERRWCEEIVDLCKEYLPSGSGFDSGSMLDLQLSSENKLQFSTSFHHMDDNGYYDGWSEHFVIVTPDLGNGYNLRVTGRDRNQIKEYIGEIFGDVLRTKVDEYPKHPYVTLNEGEVTT